MKKLEKHDLTGCNVGCIFMYVCMYVCILFIYLFVCLFVCLFIYLFIYNALTISWYGTHNRARLQIKCALGGGDSPRSTSPE